MTRSLQGKNVGGTGAREIRLIRPQDRDRGTSQTSGLERQTAIDDRMVGSRNLWMGFARLQPGGKVAPHHHGKSESGVYLLQGSCRVAWGQDLEMGIDAHAGDFVYIPPYVVHIEENLSSKEPVEFIVVRDFPQNIVVPVDLRRGGPRR